MARPLLQRHSYGGTVNVDLLRLLGGVPERVLDVGCGEGAWAGELRSLGARTLVGVEPQSEARQVALRRYDAVVNAPIEALRLEDVGGEPFDLIIVADVLEHLLDPWAVLAQLRTLVIEDGMIAISVPNLRYWRLTIPLVLGGRFAYSRAGMMDWTHLRWFTDRTLRQVLVATGWEPLRGDRPVGDRARVVSRASLGILDQLLLNQLRLVARAG